jgi:trans-aconitate 2-methyltransferase
VTTEWDAATYDRISDPQARWGAAVLDRLPLEGDERVLDAGCGSGRVTGLILDRVPRGSVVALDSSETMLEQARTNLGHDPRVEFVRADLGVRPLPVEGTVDAVFSNATFHWVADHDALFPNLAAVMRPGASLATQSGGKGNIANVIRALEETGDEWGESRSFAGVDETRRRLEESGFVEVRVWLHDEPTRFEPGAPFETFLATVVLRMHAAKRPPEDRAAFVRDVASRLPEPVIDYVRLNIDARRAR